MPELITAKSLGVERMQLNTAFPPVWITYSVMTKMWVTLDDYPVWVSPYPDNVDAKVKLVVPEAFMFDLSSIPRLLWRLIAPFELSIVAPLVHDFLYNNKGAFPTAGGMAYLTRAQADLIFYQLMLLEGVEPWKAKWAYRGVRAFGGRWEPEKLGGGQLL